MKQEHVYGGAKATGEPPGFGTSVHDTRDSERSSVSIVERCGRTENGASERVSLVLEGTFYPDGEEGRGDESPIPGGTAFSVHDLNLRYDGPWR